jgi:hypothetical protein
VQYWGEMSPTVPLLSSPNRGKFNPLMLVMHPRRIPECVDAIKALPIDKVWIVAMTEKQLEPVVDKIVEAAVDYSHLLILSDDALPTSYALDVVLHAARSAEGCVTAYCNLDSKLPFVNLTKHPFKHATSYADDYDWMTKEEAAARVPYALAPEVVPSFFAGMCLTCMPRALWRRFPFRVIQKDNDPRDCGYGSDWMLSKRLQMTKTPIVAPRGAFIWHVKDTWGLFDQDPEKRLLIGEIPAAVRFDPYFAPEHVGMVAGE